MDTVQLPAIFDQATAIAQAEQQELEPGLAGGFDTGLALSGDLEQQVSSVGGMPLITEDLQQYPTYWPGYSNASYTRQAPPQPGSPEADMATTLGTLQGALQAGADQQNSQAQEVARLSELESEAGQAIGNLQVQEVSNEIGLFNAQQDTKLRNSINAQLNAQNVAESNRQNQEAQGELQDLAIAGANTAWGEQLANSGPMPSFPKPPPLK